MVDNLDACLLVGRVQTALAFLHLIRPHAPVVDKTDRMLGMAVDVKNHRLCGVALRLILVEILIAALAALLATLATCALALLPLLLLLIVLLLLRYAGHAERMPHLEVRVRAREAGICRLNLLTEMIIVDLAAGRTTNRRVHAATRGIVIR